MAARAGTRWKCRPPTPTAGDFGGGRHALIFGLHRNAYKLENIVHAASDWRRTETGLNQRYTGQTVITALYAQDAWRFAPDWLLTTGLRLESFKASKGSQYFAGPPAAQQVFAGRSLRAASPKLSLAWTAADDLLLRASFGCGTRFPSVEELFNGTKTGRSITTSDPNLRPEVSRAFELTAEKYWGEHWLRASLFRDDVKDTILRQTQGLDISGSATWADAVVKANAANPRQVGKKWVRLPRQRYMLEASWRPNAQWLLGAAWRWHGRMFNTEMNTDSHPDVYGGASRLNQLDLKAVWRFAPHWEWSLGVLNVNNDKAWQGHPFTQRSTRPSCALPCSKAPQAHGGHVQIRVKPSDHIEPLDERRFRLGSRHADMVNVAGKRASLSALTAQLPGVEGVTDGCFFLPRNPAAEKQAGVQRLAALVAAQA